jgi:hypothetical protein
MGPQVTKKKIVAALFALFALSGSAQAGTYIFRVAVPGLQASSGSASTPPAAALSASPATVAFGLVPLGQSLSQTVTFSNTGAVAATGLVYNLPTGYTSTGNCGPTLTATGQCTETVTFTPTAAQSYPGNYTVTGLSVSAFAVLSGTGGLANLNANPTTLTFASTQISRTSAAQAVTLTNSGNAAAGSLSIQPPAGFTETDNCAGALGAGQSCQVNVVFAPSTAGTYSGTSLNITSGPVTTSVALNGTATAACTSGQSTYAYTGADQTFTVPAGCTTLTFKAYGSGGGGGYSAGTGGAGGYASGTLTTTPGTSYRIVVGTPGNAPPASYGGGGGGGYSGVFSGSTPLLIAAGGGGASYAYSGGAGGGLTGSAGGFANTSCENGAASGGTQTAGGYSGTSMYAGSVLSGSYLQGGSLFTPPLTYGGGVSSTVYPGTAGNPAPGQGGGGYYGGGAGANGQCSTSGSGGAGGSSYIGGVSGASTTAAGASNGGAVRAAGTAGNVVVTWAP